MIFVQRPPMLLHCWFGTSNVLNSGFVLFWLTYRIWVTTSVWHRIIRTLQIYNKTNNLNAFHSGSVEITNSVKSILDRLNAAIYYDISSQYQLLHFTFHCCPYPINISFTVTRREEVPHSAMNLFLNWLLGPSLHRLTVLIAGGIMLSIVYQYVSFPWWVLSDAITFEYVWVCWSWWSAVVIKLIYKTKMISRFT